MQPYVSPWLTHFVGHGHPNDDENNFQILLSILRGDDIDHWEREQIGPDRLRVGKVRKQGLVRMDPGTTLIRPGGSLCNEDLLEWAPVCFCDIPENSLGRHTKHYGAFGLAFDKRLLIAQGANPVYYVAKNSVAGHERPAPDTLDVGSLANDEKAELARYFESLSRPEVPLSRADHIDRLVKQLEAALLNSEGPTSVRTERRHLYMEVVRELLAFFKCFDDQLSESDIDNFYMEREWRVPRFAYFTLGDVKKIYVRRGGRYCREIKHEFPNIEVRKYKQHL